MHVIQKSLLDWSLLFGPFSSVYGSIGTSRQDWRNGTTRAQMGAIGFGNRAALARPPLPFGRCPGWTYSDLSHLHPPWLFKLVMAVDTCDTWKGIERDQSGSRS